MSAQCFVTIQEHAEQAHDALGPQIIEGMGGPGDVVEIFGDEGSAKTRLALSAARAIIGESTWGPFRISRNGSVLLLETDMSDAALGDMEREFLDADYFSKGDLLTLPCGHPRALYHVESSQSVHRAWVPESVPQDLAAVIIDTWGSLYTCDGGPQNAYLEPIIRAVVGQLREDYPTALLIALNHTTGEGSETGPRSMSPGLRRVATTRYKIVPPKDSGRDGYGRWVESGALQADGKFARSDKLPRKVVLRWDWQENGDPAPYPTLTGLDAAEWVALFPNISGLSGGYTSQRDALRDLSKVSSIPFNTLKTAQRRKPNPRLAAIRGDDA